MQVKQSSITTTGSKQSESRDVTQFRTILLLFNSRFLAASCNLSTMTWQDSILKKLCSNSWSCHWSRLMCIMFFIVTRLVILNLSIFWWSVTCITSKQSLSEELQEIVFACYSAVTCVKYQWHTDSSTGCQSAVETLLKYFWKPLDLDELNAVTLTRTLYNSVSCFACK